MGSFYSYSFLGTLRRYTECAKCTVWICPVCISLSSSEFLNTSQRTTAIFLDEVTTANVPVSDGCLCYPEGVAVDVSNFI